MKTANEKLPTSDESLIKPRRSKSREVSSRFLSQTSPSHLNGTPPSSQGSSPICHKPNDCNKKLRSLKESGYNRGLWPSSSLSSNKQKQGGTLREHLRNERMEDFLEMKKQEEEEPPVTSDNNNHESESESLLLLSLARQKSCSESRRFENDKEKAKESTKKNHRPFFGRSMRYSGKLRFPGKSLSSSSSSTSSSSSPASSLNSLFNNSPGFVPGRFSVDENALHRNYSRSMYSTTLMDNLESDRSECSENCSSTDNTNSPAVGINHRKSGIDVSSKFMNDRLKARPRKASLDSNVQGDASLDTSPRIKKLAIKNSIKRANSLTAAYGTATSQWALSPGRSGSPPMTVESRERPMSFSSLKPPSSPSRHKGVEKFLNMGLDLLKGKKFSSSGSILLGPGSIENVHQLRLLQNRLLQWRHANARADAVNYKINRQVEENLLGASNSISKLKHAVLFKRIQLQKQKLEMKLDFITHSQIKLLEAWGDMERQHSSAISMAKECFHSVVCRVPLIEGAKIDAEPASVVMWHASDLTASIKLSLADMLPSAEKTMPMLSQLAEIVAQEKLLLEECSELLQTISILEIQERSLKSYVIQLGIWQELAQEC